MWQTVCDWGVGTRRNPLSMKYLTQNPLEDKPSDKIIWDGTKRVYFIIPYNFSEGGGGGVVGSWQTLPWPIPSASRYPWGCLSSFSHVVLEEIDNHVCCWVRAKNHVKPVISPHVPARMPNLGLYMWSEVGHSENTLELWCLQSSFLTRWCLRDLKP